MTELETAVAAARLLAEFGDPRSAERAAGARIQGACNAADRRYWAEVQALLRRRLEAVSGE